MLKTISKTYPVSWVIAFLAFVLTACLNDSEESGVETALVHVGDAVPDFTLYGEDGQEVTAASLSGKVYILCFFDTGCPDCQQEFKVLQRLYDKYRDAVPILCVPRSQTREDIQQYWDKAGLTIPYFLPQDKKLYYKFATKTIPRTYLIDKGGKVYAAFSDSPIASYETLDGLLSSFV